MPDEPELPPMTRDEMREIAEDIARDPNSYPSAKVSALRLLKDLSDGTTEPDTGFGALDEVDAARRRKAKSA